MFILINAAQGFSLLSVFNFICVSTITSAATRALVSLLIIYFNVIFFFRLFQRVCYMFVLLWSFSFYFVFNSSCYIFNLSLKTVFLVVS